MLKAFLFGLLFAVVAMTMESLWPLLIGLLVLALIVLFLTIYAILGISGSGTGETPLEVFKRFVKEALGRY